MRDGSFSPRVKSVKDTLSQIEPICKTIGVTRIADITYMDTLYIPNFSIVLPGTEDSIWVYGGKGVTKSQAKTSGLMESVERYCSLNCYSSERFIRGTYSDLTKTYNKVLHPDEVVEPVKRSYNDKISTIDYLSGFDLINREEVLIPAELVFSRFRAVTPSENIFHYSHTNGLASGNVIEEAICQALCEVIERDAASISDLCASSIPYSILESLTDFLSDHGSDVSKIKQILAEEFVDDASIFPDLEISKVMREIMPIEFLVKRFAAADIPLIIKDITQKDIGIPTFVASSIEWVASDYGYFAKGFGTHPDSRIALIRAITELSQTRAANIQGARDDFKKIVYRENEEIYKRKWQFVPASSLRSNEKKSILFSEIKTYVNSDILDDIKLILDHLKRAGLKRAIIVDITNPNMGIPVIRAIVPGLETFEVARLFTSTNLYIGKRAKKFFQKTVSQQR